MGMEHVIVRLKPLDRHLDPGAVVAYSWLGKPHAMDEVASSWSTWSSSSSSEDDDSDYASLLFSSWDCDGCPPPFFDLPPPPRPPFLEQPDSCLSAATSNGKDGGLGVPSPYETCDNPIIIDPHLYWRNDLLNVILIVVCSLLLVGIVLSVAILIWRRRVNGHRGIGLFRNGHSSKGLPGGMMVVDDLTSTGALGPAHMIHRTTKPHKFATATSADADFFPAHFLSLRGRTRPLGVAVGGTGDPRNVMEMREQPMPVGAGAASHVYCNPNYPGGSADSETMEIGGLPFYLARKSDQVPRNADSHLYEAGSSSYMSSSSTGGPIYEDIDRMCTYRGCPPDMLVPPEPRRPGARHPPQPTAPYDERTYYNVLSAPSEHSPRSAASRSSSRPDSDTGVASANGGTSSSEVSFDSGSSPLHVPAGGGQFRGRALSPAAAHGPMRGTMPTRPKVEDATSGRPSMYYYSDTLRPGGSVGGRARGVTGESSDSGVHVDSPSPPQSSRPPLPSARVGLAAPGRTSLRRPAQPLPLPSSPSSSAPTASPRRNLVRNHPDLAFAAEPALSAPPVSTEIGKRTKGSVKV